MNDLKFIFVILVTLILTPCFAQINKNSLFLIIDDNDPAIRLKESDTEHKIFYNYWNEENQWSMQLDYVNVADYKGSNFKYLLPKGMMEEYIRRGNAINIDTFFNTLRDFSEREAAKHISLRYPSYCYRYMEGDKFRTDWRRNIFFVFKSTLSNRDVVCYEVNLYLMSKEE